MDEKSMILEQERQEKTRKRKKYKKVKIAVGAVVVLLLAGGIFYVVKGRALLAVSQANTVEIVAEEGQTVMYARIVSIYGNEITYVETQMPQMNTSQGDEEGGSAAGRGEDTGRGGFGGEMLEGFEGFGGEMPEGFEGFDRNMPGGGSMPNGENMPGGGGRGQRGNQSESTSGREDSREGFGGEMPEGFGQGNIDQEASGQITTYIPVGTEVITKLGTTTTFSRLAAGDYVALVLEEEDDEQIIMAVYIIG